jgi:hypothetical protein
MDPTIFGVDSAVWLSWTTGALYVAGIGLALFVVVLVSCMVVQLVITLGHSKAPKKRTHLAH